MSLVDASLSFDESSGGLPLNPEPHRLSLNNILPEIYRATFLYYGSIIVWLVKIKICNSCQAIDKAKHTLASTISIVHVYAFVYLGYTVVYQMTWLII